MVSVFPQLSRSTVPFLLRFSGPVRRQLSFIPLRLLTVSERRFISSQAGGKEQFRVSVTTVTSSKEGNHEAGKSNTRTTQARPSRRGGSILRKIKAGPEKKRASAIRLVVPRASSRTLPWQQRITSFEQFNYESSLNLDAQFGLRLVDDCNYRNNPELWLALIRFRERIDGVKGIAVIWKAFSQRLSRLKDPTLLREVAPPEDVHESWREVWMSFLRAGFDDHQILEEICEFMRLENGGREREINGLYVAVIGHILKVDPSEAFKWHQRLKAFPPNSNDQIKLFNQAVASVPARQALLAIYADLQGSRLYSSIIPSFCARKLYSDAISWHRMLLSRGDRPSSTSIIKPLLQHLASSGKEKLLAKVTIELLDAGVTFDTTANVIQEETPVVSRQIMNETHAKFYNIKPKRLSDEFCARLLATKTFSVKSIISGLKMLGVQAIGPLALREIVVRTVENEAHRPHAVAEYLDQLHEAEIQLGPSKYSQLIQKLVREKNGQLLYDVVTCDQHPDVFEDKKLQESLLASYHRTGDQRQINRTIALLTLDEKVETMDAAYWNILFRRDLTLLNITELLKTAEVMRAKGVPLTHVSRSYMWSKLMKPREPGHSATDTNAQTLISIWQGFMICGTYIPLTDWLETLRRLGMTGQLTAYESLAFWLARWYTDDDFRISLTGALKTVERPQGSRKYSVQLSPADSDHPFQILFPKNTQVAILAWGFQKMKVRNLNGCMPSERVSRLAASDELWGLRMIARLRDFGIRINRKTISRLCLMRLESMFGTTYDFWNWNYHIPSGIQGRWDEYVLAMEMIWGYDLFTVGSRSKGIPEQALSARERLFKVGAETSRSMERKQ
ncbi:hypothetical protein MMC18_001657 [Xylographa bjoerkii]|nr:hypothetical protein [Xylographa bjoerkii]